MKSYWDKYYNKFLPPSKPTAFAIYCKNFLKNYHNTLLDIGCGNGRDTIYFNKSKINCYGLDKSYQAIKILKKRIIKSRKNLLIQIFQNLIILNSKKKYQFTRDFQFTRSTKKKN